jgi:hypothetical protein
VPTNHHSGWTSAIRGAEEGAGRHDFFFFYMENPVSPVWSPPPPPNKPRRKLLNCDFHFFQFHYIQPLIAQLVFFAVITGFFFLCFPSFYLQLVRHRIVS